MNILAIDTALTACSVSVVRTTGNGAREFEWRPRGHAEAIGGMVEHVMARAQCAFSDLDRIAVTTGPGSFTGVRVGLAAARGIGLAANLPVIGITTFEAVAANARGEAAAPHPICVLFDARRGGVYMQIFSPDLLELTAPCVCSIAEAAGTLGNKKFLAIGSGVEPVMQIDETLSEQLILSSALAVPDAEKIAQLAVKKSIEIAQPIPLYLRKPDAKLPKKSLLLPIE